MQLLHHPHAYYVFVKLMLLDTYPKSDYQNIKELYWNLYTKTFSQYGEIQSFLTFIVDFTGICHK